ncbi:hypothetical protein L873DRAFT_1815488 [Choiromyces venosus 120613-1]|uniref:Fe2OG dioxygenase domain-containing protein n=1 Tax=Choiromyces venosus 120613-1 TaxID=1336337 RepID=A0A3N4J6F7_9PEZI|nr:hypothetical protein L873DRAFT_1815488 [Choiromyces venosus 120613-1]
MKGPCTFSCHGSTEIYAGHEVPEVKFNPEKHLNISSTPPTQITFKDLSLPRPASAASPVAGSAPFPLFSPAAIPLLRKELLNPAYLDKTATPFSNHNLIVRNTAAHSLFFKDIWTHPDVMRAVSQAAGVELEIVMETIEIGHANVQVDMRRYEGLERADMLERVSEELTSGKFGEVESGRVRVEVEKRSEEEMSKEVNGEGGLIVPWHYDSYPFVCVVMLSDTTNMVGGETVIKRGDGSLFGISQPGTGSAALLQGGSVQHLALTAKNSPDRVTLVTSYRAKAVGLWDVSFITNVRPYTDLSILYPQWSAYRLQVLSQNTTAMTRRLATSTVTPTEFQSFMRKQEDYIRTTANQIVPASTVSAAIAQVGVSQFYHILELYTSDQMFTAAPRECPQCGHRGKLDKQHLAACESMRTWRPELEAWVSFEESLKAIRSGGQGILGGAGAGTRPDLEAVVRSFWWDVEVGLRQGGDWGIADELARLGLTEYLIEYLGMFGIVIQK